MLKKRFLLVFLESLMPFKCRIHVNCVVIHEVPSSGTFSLKPGLATADMRTI